MRKFRGLEYFVRLKVLDWYGNMEQLIEVVRENPVLYDTTHDDYMRTKLKDELWEKIARELNYNDGKAAKEQWLKLRECHREALRRQQKKSGQQGTITRPWTYQKQMEFLRPFMKHRTPVAYTGPPTLEKSHSEEDNITVPVDPLSVESNCGEIDQSTDTATRKRIKKSQTRDPLLRQYIEDSDQKVHNIDELHPSLVTQSQFETGLHNDPLHLFFMSMYNTTKNLPIKYQKQVRRKLFEAVSQAEDDAEYEAQGQQINLQFSSPNSSSMCCDQSSEFKSDQSYRN